MRKYLPYILALFAFACSKEKYFDGPDNYSDDFESYSSTEELFSYDDERWSFFQNTYGGNNIELDSTFSHSGTKSIKFTALQGNENEGASKASIAKQNMAFWENEIVSVEGWYYLAGNEKAEWLFLMDLEEQTAIGAGPGMRIALVNEMLVVEHKYNNPNIYQDTINGPGTIFPRNQWVKITFEAKLSQREKGYVKIWQDSTLIIEQDNWQTLPRDILYFQQGTKGMYSSFEFGLTANSRDSDMILYVDDIVIKVGN